MCDIQQITKCKIQFILQQYNIGLNPLLTAARPASVPRSTVIVTVGGSQVLWGCRETACSARARTHTHQSGARGRARSGLLLLWCNGDCAVGSERGVEWVPSTVEVKQPPTVSPGHRPCCRGTDSRRRDTGKTLSFHTTWKHTTRCVC